MSTSQNNMTDRTDSPPEFAHLNTPSPTPSAMTREMKRRQACAHNRLSCNECFAGLYGNDASEAIINEANELAVLRGLQGANRDIQQRLRAMIADMRSNQGSSPHDNDTKKNSSSSPSSFLSPPLVPETRDPRYPSPTAIPPRTGTPYPHPLIPHRPRISQDPAERYPKRSVNANVKQKIDTPFHSSSSTSGSTSLHWRATQLPASLSPLQNSLSRESWYSASSSLRSTTVNEASVCGSFDTARENVSLAFHSANPSEAGGASITPSLLQGEGVYAGDDCEDSDEGSVGTAVAVRTMMERVREGDIRVVMDGERYCFPCPPACPPDMEGNHLHRCGPSAYTRSPEGQSGGVNTQSSSLYGRQVERWVEAHKTRPCQPKNGLENPVKDNTTDTDTPSTSASTSPSSSGSLSLVPLLSQPSPPFTNRRFQHQTRPQPRPLTFPPTSTYSPFPSNTARPPLPTASTSSHSLPIRPPFGIEHHDSGTSTPRSQSSRDSRFREEMSLDGPALWAATVSETGLDASGEGDQRDSKDENGGSEEKDIEKEGGGLGLGGDADGEKKRKRFGKGLGKMGKWVWKRVVGGLCTGAD